MTIDWRDTVENNLGILSVAGYLGPDAVRRFSGAVGWAPARGTGPVVVDLTELRSWSGEGQPAINEAARRLAAAVAGPPRQRDGRLLPVPTRSGSRCRSACPSHPSHPPGSACRDLSNC
jgi:hypothetical protein